MKLSRIVTLALSLLLLLLLARSLEYVYVAPIQNAYWWGGDETWLMSQYHEFITTAHYINPNAPGSAYARCTGVLFGSCYVTAALYGLPLILIHHHTVDVGRTITFSIGLLTLFSIWLIAKWYRVPPWLRMYGCILLASTLGFFILSHSARYDLLVGFVVLLAVALLPLIIEKYTNLSAMLGVSFAACLLLNGHILIYLFCVLAYFSFVTKPNWKVLLIAMIGGFVDLFALQFLLLHSLSIFGPLTSGLNKIPLLMVFHPKSDSANLFWRYYIANMWSRNVLFLFFGMIPLFILARVKYKMKFSKALYLKEKRLMVGATLLILSSVFLEDVVTPRYFIHVLPAIVFMMMVGLNILLRIPSTKFLTASIVLLIGIFSVYDYASATATMGTAGAIISKQNADAVNAALAEIHARSRNEVPKVFCMVPAQAIVMDDDSCVMLTWVMYSDPLNDAPQETVWKNAGIDYMIHYSGNWFGSDSYIDTSSHPTIVFQRTGCFDDYVRDYNAAGLKVIDTLRVYEFR